MTRAKWKPSDIYARDSVKGENPHLRNMTTELATPKKAIKDGGPSRAAQLEVHHDHVREAVKHVKKQYASETAKFEHGRDAAIHLSQQTTNHQLNPWRPAGSLEKGVSPKKKKEIEADHADKVKKIHTDHAVNVGPANEKQKDRMNDVAAKTASVINHHAKASGTVMGGFVGSLPDEIKHHPTVKETLSRTHPGAHSALYDGPVKKLVKKILRRESVEEEHGAGEVGTEKLTATYRRDTPGQSMVSKAIAAIVSRGKKLPAGHVPRNKTEFVKRPGSAAAPNELNKHTKRKRQVFTRYHDVAEGAPNSVQKAESDVQLGKAPTGRTKGKGKDGDVNFADKASAAREKADDERQQARDAGGGDD